MLYILYIAFIVEDYEVQGLNTHIKTDYSSAFKKPESNVCAIEGQCRCNRKYIEDILHGGAKI